MVFLKNARIIMTPIQLTPSFFLASKCQPFTSQQHCFIFLLLPQFHGRVEPTCAFFLYRPRFWEHAKTIFLMIYCIDDQHVHFLYRPDYHVSGSTPAKTIFQEIHKLLCCKQQSLQLSLCFTINHPHYLCPRPFLWVFFS